MNLSTLDAAVLDYWVFDRVTEFLESIEKSGEAAKLQNQGGLIFFLHLLGIDTQGHAHRPYSAEYLRNIRIVDEGLRNLSTLWERVFPDDRTAFLFTADHGMSNKGSHGDGERANTETPLVGWGAGFDGPRAANSPTDFPTDSPSSPANWALDHLLRRDVRQADLTPLMASLLGIPIPINSEGNLPVGLLGASPEYRASCAAANARHLWFQLVRAAQLRSERATVPLRPFPGFPEGQRQVEAMAVALARNDYPQVLTLAKSISDLATAGRRYYQRYDQPVAMATIASGYLGWISVVVVFVARHYSALGDSAPPVTLGLDGISLSALCAGLLVSLYHGLQGSPIFYYIYSVFPLSFWWYVAKVIEPTRVTSELVHSAKDHSNLFALGNCGNFVGGGNFNGGSCFGLLRTQSVSRCCSWLGDKSLAGNWSNNFLVAPRVVDSGAVTVGTLSAAVRRVGQRRAVTVTRNLSSLTTELWEPLPLWPLPLWEPNGDKVGQRIGKITRQPRDSGDGSSRWRQ